MATKITYEQRTVVNFMDIKSGEIFSLNGALFIRTEDDFEYNYESSNAICLSDGAFDYFEKYDKVEKIDVEIKVKFI